MLTPPAGSTGLTLTLEAAACVFELAAANVVPFAVPFAVPLAVFEAGDAVCVGPDVFAAEVFAAAEADGGSDVSALLCNIL